MGEGRTKWIMNLCYTVISARQRQCTRLRGYEADKGGHAARGTAQRAARGDSSGTESLSSRQGVSALARLLVEATRQCRLGGTWQVARHGLMSVLIVLMDSTLRPLDPISDLPPPVRLTRSQDPVSQNMLPVHFSCIISISLISSRPATRRSPSSLKRTRVNPHRLANHSETSIWAHLFD